MKHRGVYPVIILALIFMAFLVPAVPASGRGHESGPMDDQLIREIATGNQSVPNATAMEPFGETPGPVTLVKLEVHQNVLPGPRYMAFGPSIIGISVPPVVLSILIVVLSLCIAAWCIRAIGMTDPGRGM